MNERQKELRLAALELVRRFGKGHSGRVLSSIDLLEGLFFGEEQGRSILRCDPRLPQWEERDFFVLSKMEALPALYAVLKARGYQLPDRLPERPDRKIPGIEVTTREHGYGFCAALGLARAIQLKRSQQHVFCLMGDYELRQGDTWEAIQIAAENRLDRLCLVVDENDARDLRLQEKFEAFGWKVIKLSNAHNHDDIVFGYMRARITQRKPTCIWAPTIKSAGVPFAQRKPEYDDVVFSDAEMDEIRKILL